MFSCPLPHNMVGRPANRARNVPTMTNTCDHTLMSDQYDTCCGRFHDALEFQFRLSRLGKIPLEELRAVNGKFVKLVVPRLGGRIALPSESTGGHLSSTRHQWILSMPNRPLDGPSEQLGSCNPGPSTPRGIRERQRMRDPDEAIEHHPQQQPNGRQDFGTVENTNSEVRPHHCGRASPARDDARG